MKLIKHYLNDGHGTSPRWVYETENTIIKTIPYFPSPQSTVKKQIDLINEVCGFELIINHKIEEKNEIWKNNFNESSNLYLTYQMEKLSYMYNPVDSELIKRGNVAPGLKYIDNILKYVLPLYIDIALKIFPYGNFDLSAGNAMTRDNGDVCLIDWDDCLLGNQHDSNTLGNHLIRECVKADSTHKDNLDKKEIKGNLMKSIDAYEKLTYNTKLSKFQIDIDETVDYLHDRWVKILKREGRL